MNKTGKTPYSRGNAMQAYQTPLFFRDDWLNDYYSMRQASALSLALICCKHPAQRTGQMTEALENLPGCSAACSSQGKGPMQQDIVTSDYRFVYLGPQGTFTPLHADVLRSFSW